MQILELQELENGYDYGDDQLVVASTTSLANCDSNFSLIVC